MLMIHTEDMEECCRFDPTRPPPPIVQQPSNNSRNLKRPADYCEGILLILWDFVWIIYIALDLQ